MEGWKSNTSGVKELSQLPKQARYFIERIEQLLETEVALISTGPERDETILLKNPFNQALE